MVPPNNLGLDLAGKPVNETSYKEMIRSLIYLTVTRLDIQFSIVLCVIYQSNPKESHLIVVKRILMYPKGTPSLRMYYPKCSYFDLKGYLDSDYVGCNMDRKSTSGACQILGAKLVCWSAKKQQPVAISSSEVEYVVVRNHSSIEQVNSIQQLFAYCLLTETKVDIGEIIYSDLISRLTNKSKQKYVSYPRLVSYTLEEFMGSKYTQDKSFKSAPTILSNSDFSKDTSKFTPIGLTDFMVIVNNSENSVNPILFTVKKKKGKSQSDVMAQESDDDVLEVGEDMDEDTQADKEEHWSPPNTNKPKPSPAQETQESDSDSSSLDLKKYDNILPLTKRQFVKCLRKVSRVLFNRITEDQQKKHEEAVVSYANLSEAVKKDLALNKKVLEATEACITDTKEPPSHTKGEHVAMGDDTKKPEYEKA
nr:uncharacterized mitochondrial protein AtMg00810-like [Tanacetum cinerariifolium]